MKDFPRDKIRITSKWGPYWTSEGLQRDLRREACRHASSLTAVVCRFTLLRNGLLPTSLDVHACFCRGIMAQYF